MKKLMLFWRECLANPLLHLLFLFTLVVTLWFSMGFLTIEKTLFSYLEKQFITKLPPQTIRITPKAVKTTSLFGIQLQRPQGSYIDDTILKKIQTLSGVKKVYPFLASQIPMEVQISLFGMGYKSDVVAIGVPWEFIQNEIPQRYRSRWRKWKEGETVIALLPALLLDMYNQTLAKPNQLPLITEDFARGQKMKIVFGKSSLKSMETPVVIDGELAGFSRKIGEIALILPYAVVEHYNLHFEKTKPEYSYVLVEAQNHESLLSLTRAIAKLKLNVSSQTEMSQEILTMQNHLKTVFRLLQGLIWGLCSIAIGLAAFLSSFRRQSYYHLLRVLGESRLFLLAMIGAKYILLALFAVVVSRWSFHLMLEKATSLLGTLPIQVIDKPDTLFFWTAIGVGILPSISLFSSRPMKQL
ncbi:ABC transporter permease family protein [Thermospira aquatica]|uniref:ABC transporter permease n=1 Tax=Thermospira aquatica TaxID=2828656 RepID=A0AAX3BG25_9SPIR|nr:hypothetical protein [Thermospira aquatica]URA11255.1 hypothetical protein KDW03_05515 [Thermospira aquatica]